MDWHTVGLAALSVVSVYGFARLISRAYFTEKLQFHQNLMLDARDINKNGEHDAS